ncbi:MAG: MBL fold metallo-hydrolase [Herminiimonas sp.]|nr:MBL fold metallo-hydrolase [Herminiimonas sp.]
MSGPDLQIGRTWRDGRAGSCRLRFWTIRTLWLVVLACFSATAVANDGDKVLTAVAVSPHVYYFQGEAGMAAAANQGFMSNAGFVVTEDGVVVFDALGTPVLGAAMIAAIRKITPVPIKRIIVSHYHADHIYGLQAFKAIGAEVWAHQNGRAYLKSDVAVARLAERRASLFPWVDAKTQLVPADRWLDFSGDKVIRFVMGGIRFQLLDVSGAHSDEDIMMFVENDAVLFAGDLYFTGRIPFVGNANSRVWLAALDHMLEVKPSIVIPGHGAMSTDPLSDLRLTKDYLTYLRKSMGEAVNDMTGFEEAYAKVDWRAFAGYPAFAQANRLNAYGTYILMEQESLEKK